MIKSWLTGLGFTPFEVYKGSNFYELETKVHRLSVSWTPSDRTEYTVSLEAYSPWDDLWRPVNDWEFYNEKEVEVCVNYLQGWIRNQSPY